MLTALHQGSRAGSEKSGEQRDLARRYIFIKFVLDLPLIQQVSSRTQAFPKIVELTEKWV